MHNLPAKTSSFGMWLYIMSDCVLFAGLFATFAVLHGATAGGVTLKEIIDLPYALLETLALLASSFTCGLAVLFASEKQTAKAQSLLAATFVLGASFVGLELNEFMHLIAEGSGPSASAFLSAFFTLLGTHGVHVTVGLLWLLVLMVYMMLRKTSARMPEKIFIFSLFWHFLDIVWICIFTFVYLFGSL